MPFPERVGVRHSHVLSAITSVNCRLDIQVFGLSTQTTEYQQEMAQRIHLPFEVLSDVDLAFTKALNLPTFEIEGDTLIKRLTLIISEGKIIKFFYPVFPPDKNAEEVIRWLKVQRSAAS